MMRVLSRSGMSESHEKERFEERERLCTPGGRLMVSRSMRGSDISRGPAAELPCPDVLSLMPCTALLYTVMPSGRASPAQLP